MSFLNRIKPNKPVVGLEGYFVTILSKSKFGKTTFVYDLINEYYNGDFSKALLLAPEIGYKTLSGIHALPISDFNKTTEEEKDVHGNFGFIETVDDLIANKKDHGYRMIVVDTITALERLAVKYMLKMQSIKAKKRLTDISDIPYGGGYNLVAEEIYKQIERLKMAGFAVWIIGHEKTQTVKLKDGNEYSKTTLNCLGKTIDIIEREADLIIYGDLVKTVTAGEVSESRQLRFRSDGNIICGSRFRTMPECIDLDVPLFLETFKDAVLASLAHNEGKVDSEKMEKIMETLAGEQEAEREAKAEVYVENATAAPEKSVDEYIKDITDLIGKMDKEQQTELKKLFKDANGTVNYMKYVEIEQLQRSLAIANQILS